MRTNSFIRKFFIFITLLLVLPSIIINAISYYTAVRDTKKEISSINFEQLRLAENTLIQLEKNVVKDSFRLSIDSSIIKLNNLNTKIDLTSSKDIETVSRILDTLSDLVAVNSEYQSIYLYLEDFDYTITSNIGVVKNDLFKDSSWLRYYTEYKSKKTLLTMPKSTSDNVITYIYPLILSTNLNGALIINVKEDMVGSIINNSNYNSEEYIFIANNSGQVITHPKSRFLPPIVLEGNYIKEITEKQAAQGYIIKTVDGYQLLACYIKSSFNNWTFVSVSSAVFLTHKINEIKKAIISRTLIIIMVEILAIYLLSLQLAYLLGKYTKNNEAEIPNLLMLFNVMLNKEKLAFQPLEKSKSTEEDNYFKNLIYHKDKLNEADMAIIADNYKFGSYLCAVISIDKYDDFVKLHFAQKKDIKDFICNKACAALNEVFSCRTLEGIDNELVFIINANKEELNNSDLEKLKITFDKVREEIKSAYTTTITIGIGSCKNELSEISESYLEAQAGLREKFKLGSDNTIFWHEDLMRSVYYYPFKMEERFLNYLNTQSRDNIVSSLNELVDDLTRRSNLPCENIKQIFVQLVGNTVIKCFQERNTNIHQVFGDDFNVYTELSKNETIYEVRDWLQSIYIKIISYYNNTSGFNNNSLDLIIKYIADNYKRDIGISDISEAVGLSYSHLRKVFKDEVGESIVDYINAMRIKDAKKLLVATDLSIKSIAVNVGYNNDQSFTRFFKKYEGLTPGEYRSSKKLIKLSDEEVLKA